MASPAVKTQKKPSLRLSAPRAKESALQAQICQWLRAEQARGRVVWFCRVNGGLAQYGRQRIRNYVLHLRGAEPVGKGYADLHGMLPGGRYFALEVKRPDETVTPEQATFLDAVRAGGGIAAVVRGFEEIPSLLFPTMRAKPVVERSDERLTHFRCTAPQCQQWWSIADFDTPPGRWGQTVIFCPRCARGHRLEDGEQREGVLAA